MLAKKRPPNGKPALKPAATSSAIKHVWPTLELQVVLGKVNDAYQHQSGRALNDECRQDFIFHMTDWLDDLQRLASLYDRPKEVPDAEAEDRVFSFLIHEVPHLMAAGHLLLGEAMTHPFEFPWETRPASTKPAQARRRRQTSP